MKVHTEEYFREQYKKDKSDVRKLIIEENYDSEFVGSTVKQVKAALNLLKDDYIFIPDWDGFHLGKYEDEDNYVQRKLEEQDFLLAKQKQKEDKEYQKYLDLKNKFENKE